MNKAIAYRRDIDGLRALAVLAVIIFHANDQWLPGGFVGVDIFFVISGFLITGIIYRENMQGSFSLLNFYDRRIKRILPLFFVVLLVTIFIAYCLLLPYDYLKFSISSISTLFFASNLNYALRTGGYFDTDAEEWPLLHTWSLSVEEQFYFFWPILMLVVFSICKNKSPIKWLLALLFLMSLGSIALAEFLRDSKMYSSWNYYLMPTRAAPMLLGAFIALVLYDPKSRVLNVLSATALKHVLSITGLLFIAASLFWIDKNTPFPGVVVLIPSIGAGLIILSPSDAIINRFLSIKVIVFVGLISYSLYLWHWPLFAFARYLMNTEAESDLSVNIILLIFLATFILSIISWRFVETPCRSLKKGFWRNLIKIYGIPSALVFLVSIFAIVTNGNSSRFTFPTLSSDKILFHIDKNVCPDFVSLGCQGGAIGTKNKVALFGDSHAEHFFAFWDVLGEKDGFGVDLIASGGCSITRKTDKCLTVKRHLFETIDKYSAIVLSYDWISSSSPHHLKELQELVEQLSLHDKRIILMGQTPRWNVHIAKLWNCGRFLSSCLSSDDFELTVVDRAVKADQRIKQFAGSSGLPYLSLFDFSNTKNILAYDQNNIQMYLDEGHLNIFGARSLANNYYLSKDYNNYLQ